jgi:2-keto-4-pentenoate hydratase/2-oxohepta-3-ene-1,7-dioic acid hydratase in catechol pathway
MDAARAALANPSYVEEAVVGTPRLLAPLMLAGPDQGSMVGPESALSWPESRVCVWQPEIACVLGKGGRNLSHADAASMIFGYLLAATWTTPEDDADPPRVRSALGPCVVTAEELDLSEVTLTARVNRGVWQRESIGDAASRFARTIARASAKREVVAGEVFSSPPFDSGLPTPRRLSRDAVVEIEAGPLGVLRNRIRFRRRSESAPRATALRGS